MFFSAKKILKQIKTNTLFHHACDARGIYHFIMSSSIEETNILSRYLTKLKIDHKIHFMRITIHSEEYDRLCQLLREKVVFNNTVRNVLLICCMIIAIIFLTNAF